MAGSVCMTLDGESGLDKENEILPTAAHGTNEWGEEKFTWSDEHALVQIPIRRKMEIEEEAEAAGDAL